MNPLDMAEADESPIDPEDVLRGETGLSYGESLWFWDESNQDFDHYTVAEFQPDCQGEGDPIPNPVILLHPDGVGDVVPMDLGHLNRVGWYTLCPWGNCNTLVHSNLHGRYSHRTMKPSGKLICSVHTDESRGIDNESET